jgi:hypothetical protein
LIVSPVIASAAKQSITVIAGLDPAIHLFRKMMDARVKPAHDEVWIALSLRSSQ